MLASSLLQVSETFKLFIQNTGVNCPHFDEGYQLQQNNPEEDGNNTYVLGFYPLRRGQNQYLQRKKK